MKMNHDLLKRIIIISIVILVLGACNQPLDPATPGVTSTAAWESPTLEVSGVPTIEPTLEALQMAVQPPEKRTGNTELDPIIDAVLDHDFAGLRELTEFTIIGCTHADGLGGPPKCASGAEEGTLVEVVPFLGWEGYHLNQEEYQEWVGPDALGLLAVYRVSPEAYSDEAYPTGDFGLVFLESQDTTILTLQVRSGRVIRYDYSSGGSLQSDIESKSDEILVPLTFRPIPTKVPWNQFIDPEGHFVIIYPPLMSVMADSEEDAWRLGDRIQISVLDPASRSWITCFDQALGDCPVVETDDYVQIQGQDVRRVKGWFGAVGGRIPQEFLVYIFDMSDEALVLTLYALPFDAELSDMTTVWPVGGMELELFERTVETVIIQK
ncbi:MAG: hypothetical protein WBB69_10475 [Anaerolineales bacterium]